MSCRVLNKIINEIQFLVIAMNAELLSAQTAQSNTIINDTN